MAFEDIKEKTIEQIKDLWQKVNDNEIVIQLVEKYNNLTPLIQKLLIGFAAFLFVYTLYSIPTSFTSSAAFYQDSFQTSRDLIRGLFRVARSPVGRGDQFSGLNFQQMRTLVDTQLTATQVLPKQKGSFNPASRPLPGQLVPRSISQEGLEFEVKQLNVKQIAEIAERLSVMHPNTKLAGVQIKVSAQDDHYYDVKYTLSSLSLARSEDTELKKPTRRK